ncbi:hypothetical protein CTA1_1730, partial [Colletotrichum tanaceti]
TNVQTKVRVPCTLGEGRQGHVSPTSPSEWSNFAKRTDAQTTSPTEGFSDVDYSRVGSEPAHLILLVMFQARVEYDDSTVQDFLCSPDDEGVFANGSDMAKAVVVFGPPERTKANVIFVERRAGSPTARGAPNRHPSLTTILVLLTPSVSSGQQAYGSLSQDDQQV